MIQYVNDLSVADNLRETMRIYDSAFPFSAIELNAVEYVNKCAKWHWHDFVEFCYVVSGEVECCTPKGSFSLRPGEGYFINANALHLIRMAAGASDATYRVLQFETNILCGAGAVAGRVVSPIEQCGEVAALKLGKQDPSERALLEGLAGLYRIAEEEPDPYELRILNCVTGIWMNLYTLMKPKLGCSVSWQDTAASRVKDMLACIHERYSGPLCVADIAAAANISKREAYRSFQEVLGTTPSLYVLRYRINCGARMLLETSRNITEISIACGFASPSYFCKAFHDLIGLSPRNFRRINRHA